MSSQHDDISGAIIFLPSAELAKKIQILSNSLAAGSSCFALKLQNLVPSFHGLKLTL
jgi:hypothetical protein